MISLGDFIENRTHQAIEKDRFSKIFPDELRELYFHLILSLEKDLHVHISDRKIVKLTNLIIARAFVFRGGTVQRDDLSILKYTANTKDEMQPIHHFIQQRL